MAIDYNIQPARLGQALGAGQAQYHQTQAMREQTANAPLRKRMQELGIKQAEQGVQRGELDFQNQSVRKYIGDAYHLSQIQDPRERVATAQRLAESYLSNNDPYDDEAGNNLMRIIQAGPEALDQTIGAVVERGMAEGVLQPPARPDQPKPVALKPTTVVDSSGNEVLANFNEQTGQYLDPNTDQVISGVRPVGKQESQGTPLMKEAAMIYPDDIQMQRKWILDQRAKPTGTTVNVDMSEKTNKELINTIGKKRGEYMVGLYESARNAVKALESSKEALDLLDSGVITGFGAEFLTSLGSALNQVGISFNEDAVANSQAYGAAMAKQVAEIIKAFGAGTGLSDADREFAIKAAGGLISMNEPAIRRVIDINNRASKNAIEFYNEDRMNIPEDARSMLPEVDVPDIVESSEIEDLIKKYAD